MNTIEHLLEDNRLSWKAKGLFCYLVATQGKSQNPIEELIQKSTDGETAVRSGINELIKTGYIQRVRKVDQQGRVSGWEYNISDSEEGGYGSKAI